MGKTSLYNGHGKMLILPENISEISVKAFPWIMQWDSVEVQEPCCCRLYCAFGKWVLQFLGDINDEFQESLPKVVVKGYMPSLQGNFFFFFFFGLIN